MDDRPRYLLGKGERLTDPVFIPGGGGDKHHPYELEQQRQFLAPRLAAVAKDLHTLPSLACPNDRAVIALTVHPTYLAKSYYPSDLLRAANLRAVGSRPKYVSPRAGNPGPSTELFVAGKRAAIATWASQLGRETSIPSGDLLYVEDVRSVTAAERVRGPETDTTQTFEVVLHAPAEWSDILPTFEEYVESIGAEVDRSRQHLLRDLCVMPVRAQTKQRLDVAMFSFLRVLRPMPCLRDLGPTQGAITTRSVLYSLPPTPAVDARIRVAIFDGGIDPQSPLTAWVRPRDTDAIGPPVPKFMQHGHDVTSALLFGSLEGGEAPQPLAEVDHYRVLDATSHDPNGEYYDVLDRIVDVLTKTHYDYVNLSLGPKIPIEDDEIHPWTAALDDALVSGKTLLMSAVGNDGEADRAAGLARIQPPSDGVNLLSIGACTPGQTTLERAPYSCVGPGRSPGVTKPDLLAFGGSRSSPFFVAGDRSVARGIYGTSFASPNALRLALGVRAHLGDVVEPIGVRALLLHHADALNQHVDDVGWGFLPETVDALVRCSPTVVHVLYQGVLEPKQYRRARIPFPEDNVIGSVTIKATLCVASETDPKDPFNYTRAGALPTFRPHKDRFGTYIDKNGDKRTSSVPKSSSFFKNTERMKEQDLREDAREWETVLRASRRMNASTLMDPMFDIHYNPREGGADSGNAGPIPYALVVTIEAHKTHDLYDRIVTRYRTQLQPLIPVLQVPVRSRAS